MSGGFGNACSNASRTSSSCIPFALFQSGMNVPDYYSSPVVLRVPRAASHHNTPGRLVQRRFAAPRLCRLGLLIRERIVDERLVGIRLLKSLETAAPASEPALVHSGAVVHGGRGLAQHRKAT